MRAIQQTILFLLSAVVVYLLLFAALYYIQPGGVPLIYRTSKGNVTKGGGTWQKFKVFNPEEKEDILILGSSHAYRGYDPRIFAKEGYTSFNLGTSAQSMLCSNEIAHCYIHKHNCKLVLLDVYDRIFMGSPIESMSDIIHNVSDDKLALNVAIAARDIRAINMFTLRMFESHAAIRDTDTSGYVRGFVPSFNKLSLPVTAKSIPYSTNADQLKNLQKLLTYLRNEGIPVVLVAHPQPAVFQPAGHTQFVADIHSVADPFKIPFIDYTADKRFTGIQFFKDENHLNQTGVEVFNHQLINDLRIRHILPPPSVPALLSIGVNH